jgi:hypothetical protein
MLHRVQKRNFLSHSLFFFHVIAEKVKLTAFINRTNNKTNDGRRKTRPENEKKKVIFIGFRDKRMERFKIIKEVKFFFFF